MKIRQNEKGIIQIQINKGERYIDLQHRIKIYKYTNYYEMYYIKGKKEIILNDEELNNVLEFIKNLDINRKDQK